MTAFDISNVIATTNKCINVWSDSKPYHTGIDVITDGVYSLSTGVVITVGYNDTYSVVVQYNASICFRYDNLKSCDSKIGDYIQAGSRLGIADKFVHFEYLTKAISKWSVRVHSGIWYKTNPEQLKVII